MIYTHVARKGVAGVPSPLDLLDDLTAQQIGDAVDATGRRTGGWDGVCTGSASDLLNRSQRVFKKRECTPALTRNAFRASVRTTAACDADTPICGGHIDRPHLWCRDAWGFSPNNFPLSRLV